MSESTGERFVDDGDRYRLDSRIATGGMGEVWRATDTVLGREVAVKLLKAEYADNAASRSRFETEARHAASLLHPNVAGVYDFGEASPAEGPSAVPYLVMELVDGQPLSDLLRAGEPLDPDAVRALLAQAADALGAAHAAGIVHRDVKPANMMVTPDRLVKITDFGIARAAEGVALTETGQVLGTPQYLSPEQAQGGTATPASDVYSLGVVAFECLTGHRPYVAETAVATALAHLRDPVPDLPPSIPSDLATVVRRAMSKNPADRFPDGAAFAEALRDPATAATAVVAGGVAGGVAGAGVAATGVARPADDSDEADHTEVLAPGAATPAAGAASAGATGARARRRVPWGWLLLALVVIAGLVVVAVIADGAENDPVDRDPDEPRTSQAPRKSRTPEPTSEAPTKAPSEEPSSTEPTQEPTSEAPTSEAPTSEAPTSESPSQSPIASAPTASNSPAAQQSPSPAQTPAAVPPSPSTQQDPQ